MSVHHSNRVNKHEWMEALRGLRGSETPEVSPDFKTALFKRLDRIQKAESTKKTRKDRTSLIDRLEWALAFVKFRVRSNEGVRTYLAAAVGLILLGGASIPFTAWLSSRKADHHSEATQVMDDSSGRSGARFPRDGASPNPDHPEADELKRLLESPSVASGIEETLLGSW